MKDKYAVYAVDLSWNDHDGQREIVLAYAPDGSPVYYGDMVTLDDGATGIVLVKEDYENMEDVKRREELYGEPLRKVVTAYSEKSIDWEV